MKKEDLEQAILDLWLTTRIPLTRAHIQYHTRVSRKKLDAWLDELVLDGVLGVDVSGDGEMLYEVPGAERPEAGARSFAEQGRVGKISKAAGNKRRARDDDDALADLESEIVGQQARGLVKRAGKSLTKTKEGDKSILVSGGLSLAFGPLGWFYAGSYKEAAIGSLIFLAAVKIIPMFLLMPILFVAMPVSALAGMTYAWQHNRKGERGDLLLGKGDDDE